MKKCNGHKLCAKSRFHRVFRAPSRNFRILAIPNVLAHSRNFKIHTIPNVLAHENSYKHGFVKKCDGHKFFVKSQSIDFLCTDSEFQNTGHSQCISPWEVVRA
ncbi:hypothetical protein BHE74_00027870 [Ensete ventricosum]|nr:hypothetical protein BHE74_00027870 [Ensete ventricosum]